MALDSSVKKRTNLLNIVDRLVKKTEPKNDAIVLKKQEEDSISSPRPAVSIRPYLLPPTPSSGPASPALSDQESVSEEEQASDRGDVIRDEKEEVKKDGVPKEPLRCDVCGLRVFKSYRFVNRTSAPLHLKNFVTPDHDRIRVCKRCFSSRERCRQNLALILLRSKTSQMIHLRTPLGITYDRATKGIDYIARDLKKGLKRPYEDLLCDETMADEDEMEDDNERFLLNGDETKSKEVQIPKLFPSENGNVKQGMVTTSPIPVKNIGIVTVVRHHSGKYSSTPNCFTLYGEVSNLKVNENVTEKARKLKENGLAINVTENLGKLVEHSISLSPTANTTTTSEINTINNKLTFLDHAYALPPPKGRAPSSPRAITKSTKLPCPKEAKVVNTAKQEQQKKTGTADGQSTTSERTCGIVCFQCDKLVTKSYSCYKKENAPEKIKHLFTPGVKVVKVCRRCMPYKKPKEGQDGAGTGKGKAKIMKGKLAKLHSAKLIKNAKSAGKVNAMKTSEKTKVASLEKNSVKLQTKDEKKRKESTKDEKLKIFPASKKLCSLAVQTKKIPVLKGTVMKETKVMTVKLVQAVPKGIRPPIKEEPKVQNGKSVSPKGADVGSKTLPTSPKSGVQVQTEKTKNSTVEKEDATVSKDKSVKVDSGTQSMKSMIGINKVRTKPTDSTPSNESVVKDEKAASFNENENVAEEESTEKEVDVVDVPKKQEIVAEDTRIESKLSEEITVTKKTILTNNLETGAKEKNDEEINTKITDASGPEKDKTSDKLEEDKVETKELEDSKKEFKNTEEQEGMEEKTETPDSKNVADNIMTRGRRSASRSPVIARETKSPEALSPRKGRGSGTPETKREDKQIMPTIMTRKRLASFSESEADKKVDDITGGKRRALAAALLEKMSRKTGDSSSTHPSVSSNRVKVEHPYAKDEKESEKEVKGHCMTRRNQIPVKCAGCNEKVVKSYRCVMRGDAPVHIKPLFSQQAGGEMLRICRKCVKKKEAGNAKINVKGKISK